MEERQLKIVISGPNSAGKRSFIRSAVAGAAEQGAHQGDSYNSTPTSARIRLCEVMVRLVATPGQDRLRQLRQFLHSGADGMIFLVNAADLADTIYAKMMLDYVRAHHKMPLLICANKQDLTLALSAADMKRALELGEATSVTPLCALQKTEVMEVLRSLVKEVLTSRQR